MTGLKLDDVFAITDPKSYIANFDFSKCDVKDNQKEDYLTFKLAPTFGNMPLSEAFRKMDDDIKMNIFGATKTINRLQPEERTWDNVVREMSQSPLLKPNGDAVARSDKFIKEGFTYFKFDGSPDKSIVREIEAWFSDLISDDDIVKATPINVGSLANIVAQTGATITNLETVAYKRQEHSKKILDIGILRYPDIDHPYFKLYRIQLEAWSISEHVGPVQKDTSGFTGEFHCRMYKPNELILENLRREVREAAVKQAEDLL